MEKVQIAVREGRPIGFVIVPELPLQPTGELQLSTRKRRFEGPREMIVVAAGLGLHIGPDEGDAGRADPQAGTIAGAVVDECPDKEAQFPVSPVGAARAFQAGGWRIPTVLGVEVIGDGEQAVGSAVGFQDDIGDHRLALHVDARRAPADQIDPGDLGGRGAAQDVVQIV